jgi:hypothetical protein
MTKKSCEFQLIGGLGNQLFILAAAIHHARQGFRTVINRGNLDTFGVSHGSSVEDFIFATDIPKIYNSGSSLNSPVFKIASMIRRVCKVRTLKVWSVEVESGFVDLSHKKSVGTRHFGYFQSWKFIENETKKKISAVQPKSPSPLFAELCQLAIIEKPVIVHIRRGDYFDHVNTFGVLSLDYYKNAIEVLGSLKPKLVNYWIVSEDDLAANEIALEVPGKSRIITPKSGLSDVETLAIMKLGSAHIIANSTYSWWGAFLAVDSDTVIAPNPWFRALIGPKDLIPNTWILQESLWS